MAIQGRDDPPERRRKRRRGVPETNAGIAYPRIYRETENYPHFKGQVNVLCPHCRVEHLHFVALWKREGMKEGMKYYFLTMSLKPFTKDVATWKKIKEPGKPAYLNDAQAHRKFLVEDAPNPRDRKDEYEYEKLMEDRRKKGFPI